MYSQGGVLIFATYVSGGFEIDATPLALTDLHTVIQRSHISLYIPMRIM